MTDARAHSAAQKSSHAAATVEPAAIAAARTAASSRGRVIERVNGSRRRGIPTQTRMLRFGFS